MLNKCHSLPLMTALLFSVSPLALADDYTVDTSIDSVTVYQRGAMVHRRGTERLQKGEHKLIVTNIPGSAIAGLITAQVAGSNAVIRDQKVDKVFTSATSSVRYRELETQLNNLTDEIKIHGDAQSIVQMKLDFLKRLSDPNAEGGTATNFDAWQKNIDALGTSAAKLMAEKRTLLEKQADLKLEIDRINKEIKVLQNKRDFTYTVTITLDQTVAGSADLDLDYIVRNAGWNANYTANLDTSTSILDIKQKAVITQESGENWLNVALTLSTERPDFYGRSIEAPSLSPWFVDYYREEFRRLQKENAMEEIVVTAQKRKADSPGASFDLYMPVVETSFAGVSILLGDDISINSDGESNSRDIASWNHNVALKAVAVPRLSQKAFLYASFEHSDETPLFAGQVQLFRDGMFVGKNHMKQVQKGEDANVAFGSDPNITVENHNKGDKRRDKGFFSSDTEKRYVYDLYVKNHHKAPVAFEVRDQLPVSKVEDIKVELLKGSTPATLKDLKEKPGILAWQKTLKADEDWTIKHHYRITYPKGSKLNR